MKILFLTHDIPSPEFSDTGPIFHLIKNLKSNQGHDINLISFDSNRTSKLDIENINQYCFESNYLKISYSNSKANEIFRTLKNNIFKFRSNIKNGVYFNLLYYYYSKKMEKLVDESLRLENYDLIYVTRPMAIYASDKKIFKVIHPYDAVYEWHRQISSTSKGINKLISKISVHLTKLYEKKIYKLFDLCVVVTNNDKLLLNSLNKKINLFVLPNGVNTEFFKPNSLIESFPSIIFVSDMSGSPTTDNVLHFYKNIYPLIKSEYAEVKFYLVGRNPAPEIKSLCKDPSIIVTGYVEDVRPYIEKSSVFIAPMILGTGIKNKVLEAMAMQKPIVSTNVGAQGIEVVNGQDMFITDDEKEFAEFVLMLLNDKKLSESLGLNARRIIEEEYSWTKIIESLNKEIIKIKGDNN